MKVLLTKTLLYEADTDEIQAEHDLLKVHSVMFNKTLPQIRAEITKAKRELLVQIAAYEELLSEEGEMNEV